MVYLIQPKVHIKHLLAVVFFCKKGFLFFQSSDGAHRENNKFEFQTNILFIEQKLCFQLSNKQMATGAYQD